MNSFPSPVFISQGRSKEKMPDLRMLPWTHLQKHHFAARARALFNMRPFLHPDLTLFGPPGDSRPDYKSSQPYVVYPAPGAAPEVVLSKTIPPGVIYIMTGLAIIHYGGNPPDGTGNVVWSVQQNYAGIKGLGQITAQVGSQVQPRQVSLEAIENDILQVTVQVPTGQPPMPPGVTTAAFFWGFTYPLVEATYKRRGE
jgi:hypothetical protein